MTAITPKANNVTHFSKLRVKLADAVIVLEHSHRGNYKQIGFKCCLSAIESRVIAVQLGKEQTKVQHKHLLY